MTLNLNPAQLALSGACAALLIVLGYLLFAPLPKQILIAAEKAITKIQP